MEKNNQSEYVMLSNGKSVLVSKQNTQQTPGDDDEQQATIERIHNVWGSSSGARSDFFDIYCKNRSTEIQRLEQLEKQWKEDMENNVFQTIRYTRMQKQQQKLQKRKDKRTKKKMKNKEKRVQTQQCHTPNSHGEANDEHNKQATVYTSQNTDAALTNNLGNGNTGTQPQDHMMQKDQWRQSCKDMPAIVIHDDLIDSL